MVDKKPLYKSTEILAGLLIIAGAIAKYYGIDIPLEALLGVIGYGFTVMV